MSSFKIEGRDKDMGTVRNVTARDQPRFDAVPEPRCGRRRARSGMPRPALRLSALVAAAGLALLLGCAQPPPRHAGVAADAGPASPGTADPGLTGWSSPGGDPGLQRHSPLTQIRPDNVAQLQPAWRFDTGAPRGQQGGPLVIGDTLYLHTPYPNRVFAIALADHSLRWSYTPAQPAEVPSLMCCDVVSRGLAYGAGRLFLQQADTTLVALDAASGRVLWQVRNGDPRLGETATQAPQVFDRYVVTGIAGGEYGVRGHLSAYEIDSGRRAWRGYSVGPDADLLVDPDTSTGWQDGRVAPVGPDSSLRSWQGDAWRTGGGPTWGWYAYDPVLRLVYHGSGNPGTWNPVQRPGDNKWAMSLFARDIDSGRVRWVYQMTPHDEWDYDGVNEPILFDAPDAQGRPRRLLAHFDRNGFAYTLDRETGELLRADKFDPAVNWATQVDLHSGRPVLDPRFSPQARGEDVTTRGICPAAIGSKNQAPAAYDPQLGLFFVPTLRLCMDFEPFQVEYTAGQPYVGASYSMHPAPDAEGQLGRLLAWDAIGGRAAWSRPEPAPLWGGVLSTASGLVFYGTLDARLKAVEARSGRLLWTSPPLPSGVVGNVTSWAHAGRQYVGVLTGIGGLAADPQGIAGLRGAAPAPVSPGAFVVFALPAGADGGTAR